MMTRTLLGDWSLGKIEDAFHNTCTCSENTTGDWGLMKIYVCDFSMYNFLMTNEPPATNSDNAKAKWGILMKTKRDLCMTL
jgi:hypothetical protein